MIPFETFGAFFMTAVLLALTPGPDNIFVVTQAALRGKRAGIIVTMGLCCGVMGHTAAVALGVAAIFQTSALAFTLLKYAGAAYLLYLAYGAFRASSEAHPDSSDPSSKITVKGQRLFLRGILMSSTNPKVSIFFLAFLPQFVDPALGSVTLQIIQLGSVFILAAFLIFSLFALMAGRLGQGLLKSPKGHKIMNRIAGGVFIALALKLATSNR